tara:strand:- start:1575 stop:1823 length:249 start_codon:yes stop_codon:yes gene_type:complete
MFDVSKKLTLITCLIISLPALADSAEAWKAYQEGRNPVMEIGLLVAGVVVFFSLLVFVNKAMKSSKKKKSKRAKKAKSLSVK